MEKIFYLKDLEVTLLTIKTGNYIFTRKMNIDLTYEYPLYILKSNKPYLNADVCSEYRTNTKKLLLEALNLFPCPYGKVGDILLFKESWWTRPEYKKTPELKDYIPDDYPVWYKADGDYNNPENDYKWKSSVTMPRHAIRFEGIIIDIKVKEVNEIYSWKITVDINKVGGK